MHGGSLSTLHRSMCRRLRPSEALCVLGDHHARQHLSTILGMHCHKAECTDMNLFVDDDGKQPTTSILPKKQHLHMLPNLINAHTGYTGKYTQTPSTDLWRLLPCLGKKDGNSLIIRFAAVQMGVW